MTKPIPYKAEIALEYPEKLYIGTFECSPPTPRGAKLGFITPIGLTIAELNGQSRIMSLAFDRNTRSDCDRSKSGLTHVAYGYL